MNNSNEGKFEFGIYTFGELLPDPFTGEIISAEERIKNIIEIAKLADDLGIDVFGIGEHHRLDFAVSSPQVVLAAIAQDTKNIRLTSATTVLGTSDPVRVFEDFATLDLISGGRAEIIAGRGAFIESFPLFGYNLEDYNELFEEKLQLLQLIWPLQILEKTAVRILLLSLKPWALKSKHLITKSPLGNMKLILNMQIS